LRVLLTVWIVVISINSAYSQINFERYFDSNSLPFLETEDHLDVNFKWNMKGDVQVFVNEGINYLLEGDIQLSISNFNEAIKLDSTIWVSYYYRGIAKKKILKYDSAKVDLLKAALLQPKQPEPHLELGELFHAIKKYKLAISEYEKSVALDPNFVQGYYNLGNLELARGDQRKALKYYQKCNEVDPRFPDAYMTQGILKFKVKNNDVESIKYFDKALEVDSSFSRVYFWRGLSYLSVNKPEKCLSDWNQLIAFNPGNPFLLMMRGYLEIETGDFDAAFSDLRKAISSRDIDENKHVGGQTPVDKQIDLQSAGSYLVRTGYGLPEETFSLLKKGYCLLLSGKREVALTNFHKATIQTPSSTSLFLEAVTYEHMSKHDSAFNIYHRALNLDNDIFDAHKKRGIYYSELKQYDRAKADFNEMLRIQPGVPVAYRLRGIIRSLEGDFAGAISDLSRFIETDSSDYESLRTRAICYVEMNDSKKGNEDLRRMFSINPSDWELCKGVSQNYLDVGDTINSVTLLKEFIESNVDINENLVRCQIELATIYVYSKKFEEARKLIDDLFSLAKEKNLAINYPQLNAQIIYVDACYDYFHQVYNDAINKFTKVLRVDKENAQARYLRAKSFIKIADTKKALNDLKELKEIKYKDAEALYNSLGQH
jgi:tetratricopeptide (TPR) repeat protein